jgi:hypothetical protein
MDGRLSDVGEGESSIVWPWVTKIDIGERERREKGVVVRCIFERDEYCALVLYRSVVT